MRPGHRTVGLWVVLPAVLVLVLFGPVLLGTPPAEGRPSWPAPGDDRPRQQPQELFSEEISVDLLMVALRVVDGRGEPILGLEPGDFRVRHRRREMPVIDVEWVSGTGLGAPAPGSGRTGIAGRNGSVAPSRPPRVVFWVQPDFNAVRIRGHLRLLPHLRRLLVELPMAARMAVFSFDSRLKLWQDFTDDRELVEEALEHAVRFGKRPPPTLGLPGGLGRWIDPRAARRAATPEVGLRLTAEALQEFPGDKTLVLVGWGLGRYGSGGFRMTPDYPDTLRALDAADTTVFVLDVTDADYHTLELGIAALARNSGGSYAKTNLFASQATKRLARSLSGFYRVTIDRSEAPEAAPRDLVIKLVGRKGRIFARSR